MRMTAIRAASSPAVRLLLLRAPVANAASSPAVTGHGEIKQCGCRITERDALQNARDAQVMEVVEGKAVDEQAKHDKDDGAEKNVRDEPSAGGASAGGDPGWRRPWRRRP